MRNLDYVANLIKARDRIFFLTGAGISTESGIPDFRGPEGLYSKYPPYMFEIEFLKREPVRFYKIFLELLNIISAAKPNDGHKLIAKLESLGKVQLVATQNIDGLHQKAGSEKVSELHGNAMKFYCEKCSKNYFLPSVLEMVAASEVPHCNCGGLIRPDVVFFGEPLKEEVLRLSFKEAEESDLFIVCGSSLVVYPAAALPLVALEERIPLVIINKGETQYDKYCSIKIEEPIGAFFLELTQSLGL